MIEERTFRGTQHLSELIAELPSHCLLNKGITGCGGTTCELLSKRNSIVLVPTIAIVQSKADSKYCGVTGEVENQEIRKYLDRKLEYNKFICVYDSLPRLMNLLQNYENYFLLIDEYHLLFNDYSFRNKAIKFILDNFRKFHNWCFMTATPLSDKCILEELKDINKINYIWKDSVKVNLHPIDTTHTLVTLDRLIKDNPDKNLHIFLNSVTTIKKVISKFTKPSYRVVCSSSQKVARKAKITDPVCKLNFYTSCSFEGGDIYDPIGLAVILCDTYISTTILDVSTKVKQICGRLRDSIYKNEVYLILDANTHRYANKSKEQFEREVIKCEAEGLSRADVIEKYKTDNKIVYQSELSTYRSEGMYKNYLNKIDDNIFYDPNLKHIDEYNYELVHEVYSSSISVIMECSMQGFRTNNNEITDTGEEWASALLKPYIEYTYEQLKEMFIEPFKERGLKWNKKTSIKNYLPSYITKRRTIDGKRTAYYVFLLPQKFN